MRGPGGSGWSRTTLDPPPPSLEKSNIFHVHGVVHLPKICPLAKLTPPPHSNKKFWIRARMHIAHRRFADQLL